MEGVVNDEHSATRIIRHLASFVTGHAADTFIEADLIRVRSMAICGGYIGGKNIAKHPSDKNDVDEVKNCSVVSSFYGRWRIPVGESVRCVSYVTRVAREGLMALGYDVSDGTSVIST
eukprot:CAMPEP_0185767810 /NCGR_PEP_ID=MMETSP1174-20130828/45573_1 /TAXON_ID=35687 /ORGANISM="Dictyocha speculum, Strain CCMP1381" /LENGTH=117 /DNA_ID=CAMNT_0028452167 /DNA_START=1 /DNA_END=354 /DNA_ORIENTATION=-